MPNLRLKEERTGEVRVMNNGMTATLLHYHGCSNVDILFSDGTLVENKNYWDFRNGEIANPNYRIGETKLMKCGMMASIIAYRNPKDLDIRFENGLVVRHKQYDSFIKGRISSRHLMKKNGREL